MENNNLNGQCTEELKRLRKAIVEKLEAKGHKTKRGGIGQGRYAECVWIDLEDISARLALFEDAIIDERSGNFHPGRYGYATFFKNLADNGGACASSNEVVGKKIIYNLANRKATNLPVDEEHVDEIVAEFEKFIHE